MWDLFLGEGSCFRRGVFKYVCGLPDPGGEGARRGTRVHGRTEDYLQGRGAPLDPEVLEDSMALALAQHLPAPGTPEDLARRGVIIEGNIEFARSGPGWEILYNGRKDLEWPNPEKAGRITVTDYKTTTDFKYALTLEQLKVHVQPVIYAAHSFLRHPDIGSLDLNWLYVLSRKSPPVRPRDVLVTREHVEREMSRIDAGSKIIVEVREEGGALEEGRARIEWANTLPHDETLTSCTKYGKEGCPFKSSCAAHGGGALASVRTLFRAALNRNKRTTEQEIPQMTADELKAKLAAQKAARAGTAPAETKVQAPAAAPAKVEEKKVLDATLAAEKAAPPKFTPPTGRLLSKPPTSPGHNSVVPPQDAPPSDTEREKIAEITAQVQAGEAKEVTLAKAAADSAPDQDAKPAKAPRTRAKSTTADTVESKRSETPVEGKRAFTLCVNTIPSRPFISLATLLAPVHAMIEDAHNVKHYMSIQYVAKAAFAEALDAYLKEFPLGPEQYVYVDARTGEGADALPVLERRAGDVFRGV